MSLTLARPAVQPRDRFLGFAFAAADLLLEAAQDGTITFADGAFPTRFNKPSAAFVGKNLRSLFLPTDHPALEVSLDALGRHGRIAPLVVRLDDARRSQMGLAGLRMPGDPPRLCITLCRLPSTAPGPDDESTDFVAMAEARLRAQERGGVGFVELNGWAEQTAWLPAGQRQEMRTEILDALQRLAGPGAMAEELSIGRFGVLSQSPGCVARIAGGMDTVLRAAPGKGRPQAVSTGFDLIADGLTEAQAARALRFALSRFADGGVGALEQNGFGGGLSGFITAAESRAKGIRATLTDRRFRLAFQPIVSLPDRTHHHFEALFRPVLTPGSPVRSVQEFVTFAEAVGLSEDLDEAVLDAAASAAGAAKGVTIAVNVSGLSMQSVSFRERVLSRLRQPMLSGSRIMVELTETADIADVSAAAESLAALRAASIPVCLDDFGAGSAAFRYLREFRVDYVKLDGAYVRGASRNAREHGFLLSMVELANFVGAKTIAEMIETEEQTALMADMGVQFGQGYLFGRPGALPGSM